MRKLGLVGGMGPESTLLYYRYIVSDAHERLGDGSWPELTIENVDVSAVLRLCEHREYDLLTDYLLRAIADLAAAGADFAALSANTPHIVFDSLRERSPIPLISIVEATAAEAKRRGYSRLGLLGTIFTMTGEFYKKPFTEKGIELAVPDGADMELVNAKIASELELGVVREDTLAAVQDIIARMREENGIEAVILGCTELPLLLNDDVSPVPCLDTVKIHVAAIIDAIMK